MRSNYPDTMLAGEEREFVDDDGQGFKLRIIRANDGDFWISLIPDYGRFFERKFPGKEEQDLFSGCNSAGIRVRAPFTGGGDHPALYMALAGMKDIPSNKETCPFCGHKPRKPKR